MIHEYIDAIVENGSDEDMEELSDILEEVVYKLKEYNPKCFRKYKMKLYEMAYGKTITEEMAKDWVKSMDPPGKWTMDQTNSVRKQYGIEDISEIDFFIVMNMMYSDYHKLLGEDVDRYVTMTKLWLNDSDAEKDKLYNYKMYVID